MFAVVYTHRSLWPAIEDPEVRIDLTKMLHVGQELRWSEPVCAGDTITTEAELARVEEGRKRSTYTSRMRSTTAARRPHATWTMMVMGG